MANRMDKKMVLLMCLNITKTTPRGHASPIAASFHHFRFYSRELVASDTRCCGCCMVEAGVGGGPYRGLWVKQLYGAVRRTDVQSLIQSLHANFMGYVKDYWHQHCFSQLYRG